MCLFIRLIGKNEKLLIKSAVTPVRKKPQLTFKPDRRWSLGLYGLSMAKLSCA